MVRCKSSIETIRGAMMTLSVCRRRRSPAVFFTRVLPLCLALVLLPPALPAMAGLFNAPERQAAETDEYRQFRQRWQRVVAAERAGASFTADGRNLGPADAATWRNLVKATGTGSETDILRMVNGYFNQWPPQGDARTWGTPEYWASPAEFIHRRGGDCEDYAIAKYYAMRFFGFAPSRLRIVLLYIKEDGGAILSGHHAVLAAYANKTWFILDNNARPRDGIFPHTQYAGRFLPIYSFNEDQAWEHGGLQRASRP